MSIPGETHKAGSLILHFKGVRVIGFFFEENIRIIERRNANGRPRHRLNFRLRQRASTCVMILMLRVQIT